MIRAVWLTIIMVLLSLATSAWAQPASSGLCTRVPGFIGCRPALPSLTRSSMMIGTTSDTDGSLTPAQLFGLLVPGDVTPLLASGLPSLSLTGMGPRGPLLINNNLAPGAAGQNRGLQIAIGTTLQPTPSAGDNVSLTAIMTNENGRAQMWAADLVVLQVPGNPDGMARVLEIEINNLNTTVQPDAFSGAAPFRKNGIEFVGHSSSTARLTAAVTTWANDASGVAWWDSGIQLSRVFSTGIKAVVNPGTGTDTVQPFQNAFLWDASNSARVLRVDGSHVSVIDASAALDFGVFLKGYTTKNTNVLMRNFADYDMQLVLDAGATSIHNAQVVFNDQGAGKWMIQKNAGNGLFFANLTSGNSVIAFQGDGFYLLANGALKQVITGAVDSAGTGYRTLRVAN